MNGPETPKPRAQMEHEKLLQMLEKIDEKLSTHTKDSKEREQRIINHVNTKVNELEKLVKKVEIKADQAHAMALEAKREANSYSISSEGNDQSIFAELGSLKVVINETNQRIDIATKDFEKVNKLLQQSQVQHERERKREIKFRRAWRTVQTALIAAAPFIAQQLSAATAKAPEQPVMQIQDAGIHGPHR